MSSNIYIVPQCQQLSLTTSATPDPGSDYWGCSGSPAIGSQSRFLWFNRNIGIKNKTTYTFTTSWSLGAIQFTFTLQLTGTLTNSNFTAMLSASCYGETQKTSWLSDTGSSYFTISMPVVGGSALFYNVGIDRWYEASTTYDAVTVYINPAQQAITDDWTIIKENTTEAAIAEAYWTEERLQNARPRRSFAGQGIGVDEILEGLRANPVPSGQFPYSAVGKMWMSFGSVDSTCSGVLIDQNTFMTAAHCVYDEVNNIWATNLRFCPAYTPSGPEQILYGRAIYLIKGFASKRDYDYDVAMVRLASSPTPPIDGVEPSFFNPLEPLANWESVGYPVKPDPPYSGNTMCGTNGAYVSGSEIIVMDNNDMADGCSGGPWLLNTGTDADPIWWVNGVNSQKDSAYPDRETSPYFGIPAYSLCYVARRTS